MVALWEHIRRMTHLAGKLEGDDYAEQRLARHWLPALSIGLQRSNALAVTHRARAEIEWQPVGQLEVGLATLRT